MLRKTIFILGFGLFASLALAAQDTPQPITPENAAQLTEIARIGGDLPGALAWSPDGNVLAAGTSGGVKLYDAQNMTAPPRRLDGGTDVLFDPSGELLLSGGQLWDVATGEPIATIGKSNRRLFSPSGNILVISTTQDGQAIISLWDRAGELITTLDSDTSFYFDDVVFNADETLLVLTSDPGVAQLWNVQTGEQIAAMETTYPVITFAAFSANNRYLVMHSTDDAIYGGPWGELRIWDTRTGALIHAFEYVYDVAINRDHSVLIYENNNDLEGFLLDTLTPFPLAEGGGSPTFNAAGDILAAYADASVQSGVRLWNVYPDQPPTPLDEILPGNRFAFSPAGDRLAIFDHSTREFTVRNETSGMGWLTLTTSLLDSTIEALEFSAAGDRLSLHTTDRVEVWDLGTGTRINTVDLLWYHDLNPSMTHIAYWDDYVLHVTDVDTGAHLELPALDRLYGTPLALDAVNGSAVFRHDGLHFYDLASGEKDFDLEGDPLRAAFTPDANHMLLWESVPSFTNTVSLTLRDMADNSRERPITLGTMFSDDTAYSATNTMLAFASSDEQGATQRLFDLTTRQLAACWVLPQQDIQASTFSPDGERLVVGSFKQEGGNNTTSITVWNIDKTIRERSALDCSAAEPETTLTLHGRGTEDFVLHLVFSPSGDQLAISINFATYGDGVHNDYALYLIPAKELAAADSEISIESLEIEPIQGVHSPQFSPDGEVLLVSSPDYTLPTQLLNPSTGDVLARIDSRGETVFSPSGDLLVTDNAGVLSVWDVAALVSGETQPLTTLNPAVGGAQELAFSLDGTRLYERWLGGVIVWGVG